MFVIGNDIAKSGITILAYSYCLFMADESHKMEWSCYQKHKSTIKIKSILKCSRAQMFSIFCFCQYHAVCNLPPGQAPMSFPFITVFAQWRAIITCPPPSVMYVYPTMQCNYVFSSEITFVLNSSHSCTGRKCMWCWKTYMYRLLAQVYRY